jgi:predicted membrane protein
VPPVPPAPTAPAWAWGGSPTATAAVDEPTDDPTTADDDTTFVTDADAGGPADDATSVFADGTTTDLLDGDREPPRAPWDLPPTPVPPVPPGPPDSPHGMHGWHGSSWSHRRRRRRFLGPIVFGALLIWAGLAWLGGVSLDSSLAVGLLIIGVGFILGSFVGGSRALIVPALLVGGALALTAVVDIPLHGPIGDQRWAPQTIDELDGRYEVSIGEGTLDLTAIDLAADDRIGLEASVGVGHLVILVPEDVGLDVDTEVGAGESKVLEVAQNGVGVSTERQDDGRADAGTFVLDLQVGLGQIEVRRVDAGARSDLPDPPSAPDPTTAPEPELG